jgi:hypothetical protein
VSEQREVFLFCGSDSEWHKGKRLPVVHFAETSPGVWMERGPDGITYRPGRPFVTSSGATGRFSVRPDRSAQFPCPNDRCRRAVRATEDKLNRALSDFAAEDKSEISLEDLAAKLPRG